MKRYFILTALVCGCATFDKGAFIGLIESVVTSSLEYLREHPGAIRMSLPSDSAVSDDASISDVSSDRD